MQVHGLSVAGGRAHNQDEVAAETLDPAQNLWELEAVLVVADGMGGHQDGATASQVAVETMVEVLGASRADESDFSESWLGGSSEEVIGRAIELANGRVFARGAEAESSLSMGTTLTVLVLAGDRCTVGHVGDSRAYRLTSEGLQQLTQDHSYVAEELRHGRMTEDEALRSPFRSHLMRTVGTKEAVEPDVETVRVEDPCVFLLCSDGLTGVVGDEEIESCLRGAASASRATKRLVGAAERNGTEDNVSVAIVDRGWFGRRKRGLLPWTWFLVAVGPGHLV